nr:Chain E, HtrA1-LoopA peptide [synthetic construct]
RKLPFSKREVP